MIDRSQLPASLKTTGRSATGAFGRMTSSARPLPHFLVIGAQRCGTTSLYRTLLRHPQVVGPIFHKGIHYFDTADNYVRGLAWYRGHFPLAVSARRRGGVNFRTGEASPYYVFHPCAAERIARDLPEVRLIFMLRDPVERTFSAYKQETARGFESESFERALDLEPERLAGEADRLRNEPHYQSFAHQHHAYVERGQYAEQLERLYRLFPPDQLFVLDADTYFRDPMDQWRRLLEHLSLDPWTPRTFEHANSKPSSRMPEHLRRRLLSHFEPYDERLGLTLGDVPSWRQ